METDHRYQYRGVDEADHDQGPDDDKPPDGRDDQDEPKPERPRLAQ